MAKKRKYYVVWEGNEPGIYDNWTDCQLQIKGYPNAKYRSFPDLESAEAAYEAGYQIPKSSRRRKPAMEDPDRKEVIEQSISVDAACSGNPGDLEYRGVETHNGNEIFHVGPIPQGTNNVGEFLALVHALALLDKQEQGDVPIYSDSSTAIGWVKKKKANTKLKRTTVNARLFEMIRRAEIWLKNHEISNPLLKWDTRKWGEIPADFGRK